MFTCCAWPFTTRLSVFVCMLFLLFHVKSGVDIWIYPSLLQQSGCFSLVRDNENIKIKVSLVHLCHLLIIGWEIHYCDNLMLQISSSFKGP